MPDTKDQKCAHEGCTCMAEQGSKYCSPNCEAAKDTTDLACGCGHPACKGALAAA